MKDTKEYVESRQLRQEGYLQEVRVELGGDMVLGIPKYKAWEYANTRKGYWRTAGSPILQKALTNEYLAKMGFQSFSERYSFLH